MISYYLDKQLKEELRKVIKDKEYFTNFKGSIRLIGGDVETGEQRVYSISINGYIKDEYTSSDGERTYPTRFEGMAAVKGSDSITDPCIKLEFPICKTWQSKQMARALALNLGIVYGLEI